MKRSSSVDRFSSLMRWSLVQLSRELMERYMVEGKLMEGKLIDGTLGCKVQIRRKTRALMMMGRKTRMR